MTTNSSSIQNIRSSGSVRTINSIKNSPLFARIDRLFALYIGLLIASTTYCLCNLYQFYQLKFGTSFPLDYSFKPILCQVWLDEAQEQEKQNNHENAKSLFEKCESHLASIDDDCISAKHDKSALLLRIAEHYVKNAPTRSYEIAQRIPSHCDVFETAKKIQKEHPNFDPSKLDSLFTQAYNAMVQQRKEMPESSIPLLNFDQLLKFAEAFHSVKNFQSANNCMLEALVQAISNENNLTQIRNLCQITKSYQQMGGSEQASTSIEHAQLLLKDIPPTELIEARLIFANLFYSLKDTEKMDQELFGIMKLMDTISPLQTVKNLHSLTKLISIIEKDTTSTSEFKIATIKPKIDAALHALMTDPLDDTTKKDRAKACLNLVSIYHEELIVDSASKGTALIQAYKIILELPETSDEEIKSKFELLANLLLFYKQDPTKTSVILPIMERLYDQCSLKDDSKLRYGKLGWGQQIIRSYNELKLQDKSERFFQKYLSDLKNMDKSKFTTICNLVTCAEHRGFFSNDHYLPEQRKTQLEAAESLLSELESPIDYKQALAMIIKGYLQVDRQKSLQLLKDYSNQLTHKKAIEHLKIATITAIVTGLFYFYPGAYPVWGLGLSVVQLF